MKKYSLILVGFIALFSACNDDDKYIPTPPVVSIESLSGVFAMPQEDSIILKAKVESPLKTTLRWFVNGKETSTDSIYTFKMNNLGNYEVKLTATNADGEVSATTPMEVYGKYKYGTFILNEGRLWKNIEGTLTFISPKGVVTDSVYYKENKERLGFATQDLYIRNNKLYIISQEGGNDGGFLTIANAETLKKEHTYHDELGNVLSKPTHIAVLNDDDIYIRDGKGIYRFTPSSNTLTFIKNSDKANKTTMAVANGKIFAAQANNLLIIETGQSSISKTISVSGNLSGVIPSSDGNIWLACKASDTEAAKIIKLNAQDYTMQENNIEDETAAKILNGGWNATPYITAKGDTLYMGSANKPMPVYRHIFNQKKTDFMGNIAEGLENIMTMYNSIAVHPITGELYANPIASYGRDPENKICVFSFDNDKLKLKTTYNGYTINPAGIFFTYNFE